jgi:hypothetical protein
MQRQNLLYVSPEEEMFTNYKSIKRLPLIAAYLGVVFVLLACTVFGIGGQPDDDSLLRLEDEVVEVRDEEGDWTPVAGEATFTLVGELESMDPWEVAGVPLTVNEATQIEEDLQLGDLVSVQGTVLEDGTWLAYIIELAEEQADPIITLIGVVDSIDPWVVNGFQLNVTDETEIQGEVTVGMIVRAEILLLEDGTWEVLSIAPLGESIEASGCVTAIATVLSVDGDEIQFLGWPMTVTLVDDEQTQDHEGNDNDGNENDDNDNVNDDNENGDDDGGTEINLIPGQVVMAVVCISDDGQLIIVQIIVLEEDDGDDNGDTVGGEKVLICHRRSKNPHTLSVAPAAVPAHLAHGDTLGPCP